MEISGGPDSARGLPVDVAYIHPLMVYPFATFHAMYFRTTPDWKCLLEVWSCTGFVAKQIHSLGITSKSYWRGDQGFYPDTDCLNALPLKDQKSHKNLLNIR